MQLYAQLQRRGVTRPVRELVGFDRVALNAGDVATVTFHLQPALLAYYDVDMNLVVTPGEVELMAGPSSATAPALDRLHDHRRTESRWPHVRSISRGRTSSTPEMNTFPGAHALSALGLAPEEGPAASPYRFPDGGAWRIEIPSVEGIEPLRAVLEEARALNVPVHRVSQGSGVMMLSDAEISEMLGLAADAGVEVCLFLGPRGTWDIGAAASASGGAGPRARGTDQLGQCLADLQRAADLGVRKRAGRR